MRVAEPAFRLEGLIGIPTFCLAHGEVRIAVSPPVIDAEIVADADAGAAPEERRDVEQAAVRKAARVVG